MQRSWTIRPNYRGKSIRRHRHKRRRRSRQQHPPRRQKRKPHQSVHSLLINRLRTVKNGIERSGNTDSAYPAERRRSCTLESSVQASKWRQCVLDDGKLITCNKSSDKCIPGGGAQKIRRKVLISTVLQRAERVGYGNGTDPPSLTFRDVAVMKDNAVRNSQPPPTPSTGQREVDLRGKHIRQIVEGERSLVGDDPLLLRPKPDGC